MCGRFALLTHAEALIERFGVEEVIKRPEPRYNIAPSQTVTVVVQRETKQLTEMRWGLIPFWAKDVSIGNRMINARSETVSEKPAFRSAFKKRRCLILADGFYEWQKLNGRKQPVRIQVDGGRPFAIAGLWEHWQSPDGSEIESCTLLTTEPNELLKPVHNRMPVIISPQDYALWLDPGAQHPDELKSLLRPYPAEHLSFYSVSTHVNNPRNEDPLCIKPI